MICVNLVQKLAYKACNIEFTLVDRKSGDIIGAEQIVEASENYD